MDLLFLEQRIKRSICETDGSVFTFVNGELKSNKTELQKGELQKRESEEEKKEEETLIPPLDICLSKDWIFRKRFVALMDSRRKYGYINTSIYKGPTSESNWLIRKQAGYKMGSLAVGGYPDTHGYLDALIAAGINTFVNLCKEYGTIRYPAYANNKTKIPDKNFLNEPIQDMRTTDDTKIDNLASRVVERLLNGENVYIHCAGGHGRTGTLAALVLKKLYPHLKVDEIFEYIQYAHDQRVSNWFGYKLFTYEMMIDPMAVYMSHGQVPSPQTGQQRNQVRRLLGEPEIK